ncbi:RNA-directed DNA polymerase, eukaryota, reverse transcriptase zinc-binding domain protein [Tanacetum coccineum]
MPLTRPILDGPFILNEIAAWCKANKEKAYVFKVDFQKAYDSIRWDVLDEILKNFCFGSRWRSWVSGSLQSAMASLLVNGSPTELPFEYLGLMVGENMTRLNSWKCVVDKVTSKLSNWKAKTLSIGGRLTLIKSVLGAIPTFYMSLFKAPEGVLKNIEALRNRFFLGADENEKRMIWVAWKMVLSGKKYGGSGVNRYIFHIIYALENQKNVYVAEKMTQVGWTTSFHRLPRGGVEAA